MKILNESSQTAGVPQIANAREVLTVDINHGLDGRYSLRGIGSSPSGPEAERDEVGSHWSVVLCLVCECYDFFEQGCVIPAKFGVVWIQGHQYAVYDNGKGEYKPERCLTLDQDPHGLRA